MEMIIRKLTNPNIIEYMNASRVDKYKDIIAQTINLIAHYRKFFTNNKHRSNIILYMGFPFINDYDNSERLNGYRKTYCEKFKKETQNGYLTQTLEYAIPIIKDICEYIDGVYFITSNILEPSLVPYIVNEKFIKNDINIILTNDIYDFQYAKYKSFYPIRIAKGYSYIIKKNDVSIIEKLKLETKTYNDKLIGHMNHIPFILSVIGNNKRDIPKITRLGLSMILKTLQKGIEDNLITEYTDNVNLLVSLLPEQIRMNVISNYICTDISYQYKTLQSFYERIIKSQINDRFDNLSLKELADKYFTDTPILVEGLNNYDYKKSYSTLN